MKTLYRHPNTDQFLTSKQLNLSDDLCLIIFEPNQVTITETFDAKNNSHDASA
ncbi:hypothetical protein [Vibrio vulnificus YJ016]|uniref:Uncharacterized protein n=1 Tax=Vibrio vulnificus (strain YJ016) TaxID=196600 RepID=Q7MEN9_VIBVY|nr:hypothetical protein [Vibrio vulnificus YJ016]